MFHTDTLSVKPITYQLDFDDETMKKLRPFFKLHSGSFSRITKTFGTYDQGTPKGDDVAKFKKKEKGNVTVELWNGSSSRPENLIGHGELNYNNLQSKEGQYEEWIPLMDRYGKQVGKALVEVNIAPADQSLSVDDTFKRSIGDLDFSFKRALEDMNRSWEHFNRSALPGWSQPSLTGPQQSAIESGKATDTTTSTTGQNDKQLSTRSDDENKLWSQRRSVFDSTFEDMHNMFERTLEDMHNRFEDMFSGFGSWSGYGRKGLESGKNNDLEAEKGSFGHSTTASDKGTSQTSTQSELRDRGKDWKGTNENVEIKDETNKHVSP